MTRILIALLLAVTVSETSEVLEAKTLTFAGRTWNVTRNGRYSPGPNFWSEDNAWVDSQGQLHLKISHINNRWYSAQLWTTDRLGFGTYEWQVVGRLDALDKNVVLGLYPYMGPSNQNEIDIEISGWGKAGKVDGNFAVWPPKAKIKKSSHAFAFKLDGAYTTHRFKWDSKSVFFQMLHGHRSDNAWEIAHWKFSPRSYQTKIPQQPMPVYMNLWLFQGQPPSDGKEVEVVIKSFSYTP
jgi:hypothetical protein